MPNGVTRCRRHYVKEGIPFLNVSEMSVEEIATRIIQLAGLKRRIN